MKSASINNDGKTREGEKTGGEKMEGETCIVCLTSPGITQYAEVCNCKFIACSQCMQKLTKCLYCRNSLSKYDLFDSLNISTVNNVNNVDDNIIETLVIAQMIIILFTSSFINFPLLHFMVNANLDPKVIIAFTVLLLKFSFSFLNLRLFMCMWTFNMFSNIFYIKLI